jgi:hypothetical protein
VGSLTSHNLIGLKVCYVVSFDGIRVINCATYKNLRVESTIFPHRNIHKNTWMSSDRKTHNQIVHILIDKRRHSIVVYVRSFTAADFDTDHYLVVANVWEGLAVNEQSLHRFHMERFDLKKLNEAGLKRSIALKSIIGLELWKIQTLKWESIVLGKRLEKISKYEC